MLESGPHTEAVMKTKVLRSSLMLIAATVLLAIFPRMLPGQQEPSVYMHGGNAEALVNGCSAVDKRDASGQSYCFGYILGVVDMHNALNSVLSSPRDNTYCIPDNASAAQLAKVVVKYGNDHPEEMNEAALLILSNAFVRAFPCK